MVELQFQQINIDQQALEAKEAGEAEVARLLQAPEDLARLAALRAEWAGRCAGLSAGLSAAAAGQVEAARYGLALLDKSHRHIAKLRTCIDRIDQLCGEAASLVEHHDKIRSLSLAHANVVTVLEELGDIIDLPQRAAALEALLTGAPGALVTAFEGLTVLEGTANNVKEAWRRNAKKQADLGELMTFLERVGDTSAAFERRLWGHVRNFMALGREQPGLLVDCARCVELQEQMDAHYTSTKASYCRPKHYRERALLEMEAAVGARMAPLLVAAQEHGKPNSRVKYDQEGNRVVGEVRDYLGALQDVTRLDAAGRQLPGATDAELALLQIHEEEVFDEGVWLQGLLEGLAALEAELAVAYDYVAPCWPPHYHVFDSVFQMVHVQVAQVVDAIGQVAESLSSPAQLALMQWIGSYQSTLRGLGVQEELVHLPVAPLGDGTVPGLVLLIESHTGRVEASMKAWYTSLLQADLAGDPQQRADGTLATLGAGEFFSMLNSQIAVLEEIGTPELLLAAATRSFKVIRDFTAAQLALLAQQPGAGGAGSTSAAAAAGGGSSAAAGGADGAGSPPVELDLEKTCALLNNNLDWYEQSLEFTEGLQTMLEGCAAASSLDVEEPCRAFLEVAKACGAHLGALAWGDAGLAEQVGRLYAHPEWRSGTTMGTILATIGDYFGDFTTFVKPSWVKRLVEGALEELGRRAAGALLAAAPAPSPAVTARMKADEAAIQTFFEPLLPLDKIHKRLEVFVALRGLMTAAGTEGLLLAYAALLEQYPAPPGAMDKMAAARSDLSRTQLTELSGAVKEVYARHLKKKAGSAGAAAADAPKAGKGWRFWK